MVVLFTLAVNYLSNKHEELKQFSSAYSKYSDANGKWNVK